VGAAITEKLDDHGGRTYLVGTRSSAVRCSLRSPRRDTVAQKKIRKLMVEEAKDMWEKCAVDLRVELPRGVAAEVEEVLRRDPEMLNRVVLYAVTRRTIFDHLATRTAFGTRRAET
jgi:hypothetical protein